jgi:iron complex outermembrane receptor protein
VWDLRAGNRLIFGGEARRNTRADYRAWEPDGPYFVGDFPFDAWSAFAQDEIELGDRVTVIAGVRHDRYAGRVSTSPRASLIFTPAAASTLKLLYGEAFRAPNVYERTYWDNSFTPNPSLAPERVRTLELVLQQRVSRASFAEVSIYRFDMRDLIDSVEDTTSGMFGFENIDQAIGIGAELDVKVRLNGGLSSYFNFAAQRASDEITGQRLTNSPARLAKAGVSTRLAPGIEGALELRYESSRTTLRGTRTDDVVLGRLNVRAPVPFGLHAGLLIDNLLDTRYATPASFEHVQTSIPQDGRTVSLRLERRF